MSTRIGKFKKHFVGRHVQYCLKANSQKGWLAVSVGNGVAMLGGFVVVIFQYSMGAFQIAHISDLHFAQGADGLSQTRAHSLLHLGAVENVLNAEELDLLIVTGDLTDAGDVPSLRQAHDWIFGTIPGVSGRRMGLNFPKEKCLIVPGNHDAFNNAGNRGHYWDRWQKSLENYRSVFGNSLVQGVQWQWREKGTIQIYLAALDSCYFGDPEIERRRLFANWHNKVARGKVSLAQSQHLLKWTQMGRNGNLMRNGDPETLIGSEVFQNSLKVLVMHHYLFEPGGVKRDDFFLKIRDRDAIIKSLALAGFDMILCGHKHHTEVKDRFYWRDSDLRSRMRHLIQEFRLLCGFYVAPDQLHKRSRQISPWLRFAGHLLALKLQKDDPDAEDSVILERFSKCFADGIDNPESFGRDVQDFAKRFPVAGRFLEYEILRDIEQRLIQELNARQRGVLSQTARSSLGKIVRTLEHQRFTQCMSGASGKRCRSTQRVPSFHIYSISDQGDRWAVKVRTFFMDRTHANIEEGQNEFFVEK